MDSATASTLATSCVGLNIFTTSKDIHRFLLLIPISNENSIVAIVMLGKPVPSKSDEFSEKFRRGGGSKVSCFLMCPVLIFLIIEKHTLKNPFVSFSYQKSPV